MITLGRIVHYYPMDWVDGQKPCAAIVCDVGETKDGVTMVNLAVWNHDGSQRHLEGVRFVDDPNDAGHAQAARCAFPAAMRVAKYIGVDTPNEKWMREERRPSPVFNTPTELSDSEKKAIEKQMGLPPVVPAPTIQDIDAETRKMSELVEQHRPQQDPDETDHLPADLEKKVDHEKHSKKKGKR